MNANYPPAGNLTAIYHAVRFCRVFFARRIEGEEICGNNLAVPEGKLFAQYIDRASWWTVFPAAAPNFCAAQLTYLWLSLLRKLHPQFSAGTEEATAVCMSQWTACHLLTHFPSSQPATKLVADVVGRSYTFLSPNLLLTVRLPSCDIGRIWTVPRKAGTRVRRC